MARELALVKVATSKDTRSAIIEIVDVFRAKIVDVAPDSLVIEATGTEDKIDAHGRDADAVRAEGAGADGPRRDGTRRHEHGAAARRKMARITSTVRPAKASRK